MKVNKMELLGNTPVPKALAALGIPTMTGMLINALYNLADTWFVNGLAHWKASCPMRLPIPALISYFPSSMCLTSP